MDARSRLLCELASSTYAVDPPSGHVVEGLALAAWPADFDFVHRLRITEAEVKVGERARGVRRRHPELPDLGVSTARDAHTGSEHRPTVAADLGKDADPALAAPDPVFEEPNRSLDVHDRRDRDPRRCRCRRRRSPVPTSEPGRGRRSPSTPRTAPSPRLCRRTVRCAYEESPASTYSGSARLVVADHPDDPRREMAADRVQVGPAVVVEIGEMRAPPHERQADAGRAGRFARVFEERSLDVAIEAVRLARRSSSRRAIGRPSPKGSPTATPMPARG